MLGVWVLAGFTSHASSSKPDVGCRAGADVSAVSRAFAGGSLGAGDAVFSRKASGSTVSLVCTAGAGLPFLVLFLSAPPGPLNKPPPLAGSMASGSCTAPVGCAAIGGSPPAPPLCLPNRLSRLFITRKMSPSFSPRVRKSCSFTSCRFSSLI